MRETTAEEEDMLEKQRIREKKLADRGPAKYPFPSVPPPNAPPVEKNIRFLDPDDHKDVSKPKWCPYCRGPFFENRPVFQHPKGWLRSYKCRDCKQYFLIQVGIVLDNASPSLNGAKPTPNTFVPRQADRLP